MQKTDRLKRAIAVVAIATVIAAAVVVSIVGCGTPAISYGGQKCAECGSQEVIPIVYGLPGPELLEQAEAGEVFLGGCIVGDDSPVWHCNDCGHQWGRFEETRTEI